MSDQYNNDPITRPEGDSVPTFEAPAQDFTPPSQPLGEDFTATSEPVGRADELPAGEKFTPEKLGDMAIKFATETAYAAAGLANTLSERAKEFYDAQRKQIAEKAPEGVDPNFRQFVDTMPDQFKTFVDDMVKAYRDMADKGRSTVADLQAQVQNAREQKPAKPENVAAFDLKDDAGASADAENVVAPDGTRAGSFGGDTGDDTFRPAGNVADTFGEHKLDSGDQVTDAYPGEAKDEFRS